MVPRHIEDGYSVMDGYLSRYDEEDEEPQAEPQRRRVVGPG
ncbi:hypothetical protein [Natronomonas sp.]